MRDAQQFAENSVFALLQGQDSTRLYRPRRCGALTCWHVSDDIEAAAQLYAAGPDSPELPLVELPDTPAVRAALAERVREQVLAEAGGTA
jgi:hypothetical protein